MFALCALGGSCSPEPGSELEPRLHQLEPGWGVNTRPVSGVIRGDNFLALPTQHIGGDERVTVDARFEAFLDDVALEDVTVEDSHTLRARIPEGLALGWHTLAVVGPLGQRVELPRAYYVREREVLTTSLAVSPRRVTEGEFLKVTLKVANPGERAVLAVVPGTRVVPEGQAELVSGPVPASVDIPAGESRDFEWTYAARAAGTLFFLGGAVGRDGPGGAELSAPEARSAEVIVQVPGALVARFSQIPEKVNVGQPFDVALEVRNPGDTAVLGVELDAAGFSGTARMSLVSGPEPARVDISAKGRAVFHARLVARSEGSCVLGTGGRGVEQTRGVLVKSPRVSSSVSISSPRD